MTHNGKLLGVRIDSMLNFNQQEQSICKKASNKVRAFSRIAPNLEYEENVMLYNSFALSNFLIIVYQFGCSVEYHRTTKLIEPINVP